MAVPPDDWLAAEQYSPPIANILALLGFFVVATIPSFRWQVVLAVFLILLGAVSLFHAFLRFRHETLRGDKGVSPVLFAIGVVILAAGIGAAVFAYNLSRTEVFQPQSTTVFVVTVAVFAPILCVGTLMTMAPKKTHLRYNPTERLWHIHESQLFSGGIAYGGTYSQLKSIVITLRMKRPRSRYLNVKENLGWSKSRWKELLDETRESVIRARHRQQSEIWSRIFPAISESSRLGASASIAEVLEKSPSVEEALGLVRDLIENLNQNSEAGQVPLAIDPRFDLQTELSTSWPLIRALANAEQTVRYINDGIENNYVRPNDSWPWMAYGLRAIESVQKQMGSADYEGFSDLVQQYKNQLKIRKISRKLRYLWLHEALVYSFSSERAPSIETEDLRPSQTVVEPEVIPTVALYAVVDRDPDLPLEIRHYPVLSELEASALQFTGQRYKSVSDALGAATVDALDLGVSFEVTGPNASGEVSTWATRVNEALNEIPRHLDASGHVAFTSRRRAIISQSFGFVGKWIISGLQCKARNMDGGVQANAAQVALDLESSKKHFRVVLSEPHVVLGVPPPIEDSSQLHPFLKYIRLRFISRAKKVDGAQTVNKIGEQAHGTTTGKSSKFIEFFLKLSAVLSGVLMMGMMFAGVYVLGTGTTTFFQKSSEKEADFHSLPNELILVGLHSLEIIILAPLPYLLILGLRRYVNALARNKDAKRAKAELLDFKAFEVALLISVMAAFILSVFIESISDGKDAKETKVGLATLLHNPGTIAVLALILVILVGYYALLEFFADKQGEEARANPTDIVPFVFEAERLTRHERYREAADMYDQAAFYIMANSSEADAKALFYEAMADACRLVLAEQSSDFGLKSVARSGLITHLLELHETEIMTKHGGESAKSEKHLSRDRDLDLDAEKLGSNGQYSVLAHGVIAFCTQHQLGVALEDPLHQVFKAIATREIWYALLDAVTT